MSWIVEIGDQFKPEFFGLDEDVQTEILALARLLQQFGPQLRFSAADGEWRVAFAFDPKRKAMLLVAGDKSGVSEKQFYRGLIRKADARFDAHLIWLKKTGLKKKGR